MPVITGVWLVLNAGVSWVVRGSETKDAPEMAPLFKHVPQRLGTDVVSLVAEQHYIRLTTSVGSTYFLYALRQAILELEEADYDGIQCHRSTWVALKHTKAFRQKGSKAWVEMQDGSAVPISRRRRTAVKAAVG